MSNPPDSDISYEVECPHCKKTFSAELMSGGALLRGTTPHFPALLQPLLTSPAWLVGDTHLAYHLVQTLEALLMSLAAIPVYWLARRLGLGQWLSFGLAALALAIPDLLYA